MRWWRTGETAMLQFMELQRIEHNLATEQQQLSLGDERETPAHFKFAVNFWLQRTFRNDLMLLSIWDDQNGQINIRGMPFWHEKLGKDGSFVVSYFKNHKLVNKVIIRKIQRTTVTESGNITPTHQALQGAHTGDQKLQQSSKSKTGTFSTTSRSSSWIVMRVITRWEFPLL